MPRRAFTLIELLVVIAILAVLAVVVVLTLNPAGLLQESRDATRISDMATLNSAIGYAVADNSSASLGSASTTYISAWDASATSTAGDQCQGSGLPSSSATWQCAASSSYRQAGGLGWIPVNFASSTFGAPIPQLPVDPINATSSGRFYTYQTNGTQFEVTALLESQKYKLQYAGSPVDPYFPEVVAQGSNLTLSALWNPANLVGWWPLDEGSGSSTADQSGNGNNGTWNGSLIGGSHYAGGKVGAYSGNFDGTTDYVDVPDNGTFDFGTSSFSFGGWIQRNGTGSNFEHVLGRYGAGSQPRWGIKEQGGSLQVFIDDSNGIGNDYSSGLTVTNGLMYYAMVTVDRTANVSYLYVNGSLLATKSISTFTGTFSSGSGDFQLTNVGGGNLFNGIIDDARVYRRALSAAEVQALYNAEK